DWNADGLDTVGLYRDGVWRLRNSNSTGGADTGFTFNAPGVPIANYRGGVSGLTLMNQPVAPTMTPTISFSPTATTAPVTVTPT
ncbi:hypothetical protein, partial [Klebsiella quasipneumoniae]|uniref:hypothetical protein n=1 Tax=Klebsiella quasipneumoniae TaxID=1463165 RepID=UPI0027300D35